VVTLVTKQGAGVRVISCLSSSHAALIRLLKCGHRYHTIKVFVDFAQEVEET
jgi:hypothetical protein